jgi:PKD repeat protein
MKLLSSFLFSMLVLTAVIFTSCSKDSDSNPNKPSARFSASVTSIVKGGTVTFTNTSTNATDYLWKFGDGTSASSVSPTHTYDSIGNFNVTLIALGSGGRDTLSLTVTVASNNITILDGTGIRETNLGATWSSIEGKFGSDTSYTVVTSVSQPGYYYHFVTYYDSITYIFVSKDTAISISDAVMDIQVAYYYTGTTKKGVAIWDSRTNVTFYYGTPTQTYQHKYQNSTKTYSVYDYTSLGIAFYIDDTLNQVFVIEVYSAAGTKKAGISGSLADKIGF